MQEKGRSLRLVCLTSVRASVGLSVTGFCCWELEVLDMIKALKCINR
jgi:hypothetical protein